MHKEELQMQYEEKRFYQLVKQSYKCFLYWKKKELELKQKLTLYLESLKEICLDDEEKMAKIQKSEKDTVNFYMPARWRGEVDFIEYDFSQCKTSERKLRYVLNYIDKNLKLENTYLFRLCKEADFAQADFENQAKLAENMLKHIQENGEKLSENRCDIKLLIVLYFYFRLTPAWLNCEIYTNKVRVMENIIFPKSPIYEEFSKVFDAKKNPQDYWFQCRQFQENFGRAHEENSKMNKYWITICRYAVKQKRL